jgi:hypothetical protein
MANIEGSEPMLASTMSTVVDENPVRSRKKRASGPSYFQCSHLHRHRHHTTDIVASNHSDQSCEKSVLGLHKEGREGPALSSSSDECENVSPFRPNNGLSMFAALKDTSVASDTKVMLNVGPVRPWIIHLAGCTTYNVYFHSAIGYAEC